MTTTTKTRAARLYATTKHEAPEGSVFIGHGSKWFPRQLEAGSTPASRRERYRESLMAPRKWQDRAEIRRTMRGKDIASACPQWDASFVDVLIEIANGEE